MITDSTVGIAEERLINSQLVAIRPYRNPRWNSHNAAAAHAPKGNAMSGTAVLQDVSVALCATTTYTVLSTQDVAIVNRAICSGLHAYLSPNLWTIPITTQLRCATIMNQ